MHRRVTALFGLIAILMMAATSLPSLARSTPDEQARNRVVSPSLAQASPVAMADAVVGNLTITIVESAVRGEFEYTIHRVQNNGYIVWNNESDATHDLEITVQGVVTNKVQLEPEEKYRLRLHAAGTVHWECTTHGEGETIE